MNTLSKKDAQWDRIAVSGKVLVVKPDDNGFYPVGFSYLLGAWDEVGIRYDYVDMFLYPDTDIEDLLRRNEYLAVCTGGLLGSLTFLQTLFARVKKTKPDLPCVLGGNVTTDFPTALLFSQTEADYLVFGEGEITGTLLLSHIQQHGAAPTDLLGVAYRSTATPEGFIRNRHRPPLDLAAHNWQPTWKFLEVDRYAQRPHCTLRLFPVLTGRGCKGRCSFCSPTNGAYRGRPLDHVFQEIEGIIKTYDFDYLHFLTEIFFQQEAEVLEFCRRYKTLARPKPWACLQRMDTSPRVLAAMKDAGCFTINVGVESGSDRVLREMKKDITVAQIRSFVDRMKACDMGVEASFMVGNYDETETDIISTVDLMLELGVGGPKAMCVNYPGTLNFIRAQKRGLVPDVLQYAKALRRAYTFDWLQHIEAHKSGDIQYLNITAMDDDTLFEVVVRELRRLHEYGYHVRDVQATPVPQAAGDALPEAYDLRGACPFCGAGMSARVYLDDFQSFEDAACPHCLAYQQKSFFAPLDVPEVRVAFAERRPRLDKARRCVLLGPDQAIRTVLRRGWAGFDFSRVVGVVPLKEGNPCQARFLGHLPVLDLAVLRNHGVDLAVSVAAGPAGLRDSLGEAAMETLRRQGVDVVSLFPFGVIGRDVPVTDLPAGKVLAVASAQPPAVRSLLQDLRRAGCDVSLLVPQPKQGAYLEHLTGQEHIFPGKMFHAQAMSEALLQAVRQEGYDYAVFPYSQSLEFYENVLKCIIACGIDDIYIYHANNSTVSQEDHMAFNLPHHVRMRAMGHRPCEAAFLP